MLWNMLPVVVLTGTAALSQPMDEVVAVPAPLVIHVPAPVPLTAENCCAVKANTTVNIEILDHVNSKLSKRGDTFAIRLAEPIRVDGHIIIPAGAPGMGEVVHAARARAGGKAGELILAVRYFEHEGAKVPLRGFKFGSVGTDNGDVALAVGIAAGPLAYFVSGGEVDVPSGTRANAKISADTSWPNSNAQTPEKPGETNPQ